MNYRRYLPLLVALLLGSTLVMSSGGFSSLTADRDVELEVADNENAYLKFEQSPTNTENGTTDLEVTVTNQFPSGTSLSVVAVTINGETQYLVDSGQLESGASAMETFRSVTCGARITVEASNDDVEVCFNCTVICE
jgi:hypothetical protein